MLIKPGDTESSSGINIHSVLGLSPRGSSIWLTGASEGGEVVLSRDKLEAAAPPFSYQLNGKSKASQI